MRGGHGFHVHGPDLARGEIPKVDVVTNIYDRDRLLIASVTTVWQVKPWKLVEWMF